jgi:hypothetical protein
MGIVIHKATIVTSFNMLLTINARQKAASLFHPAMVTGVFESPVNSYYSFAVLTCGSKSGWDDKTVDDRTRSEFEAWIAAQAYDDGSNALEFVTVEYGDDLAAALPTTTGDSNG